MTEGSLHGEPLRPQPQPSPRVDVGPTPPMSPAERDAMRVAFERWSWIQARLARSTPLTWVFIALLVAIHLLLVFVSADPEAPGFTWMSAVFGSLPGEVLVALGAVNAKTLADGEWWRLVYSALLHASALHIGVNMYAMHSLGREVERMLGRYALCASLAAGALAGSYASATFEGGAWAVGASAGILGLAGTLATGLRGPVLPPQAVWAFRRRIAFMVLLILGLGLAWNRTLGQGVMLVANAGHAGGFLGGLLLGAILPAPGPIDLARTTRRSLASVLAAVPIVAAIMLLGQGGEVIAKTLRDARSATPGDPTRPFSLRERLVRERQALRAALTEGPLEEIDVRSMQLSVSIPERWQPLTRRASYVAYGPGPGSPLLQILEAPLASPQNVPGVILEELAEDADEFFAAPIERGWRDGYAFTRLEAQYGTHGRLTHQVRYLFEREKKVVHVLFLGSPPRAADLADRILPTLRLRKPPVRRAAPAPSAEAEENEEKDK